MWEFEAKITPKLGTPQDEIETMHVFLDIHTSDGSHLDVPGGLPKDTVQTHLAWTTRVVFAKDVTGRVDVKFSVRYWDNARVVSAPMPAGWVIECAAVDTETPIAVISGSGHSENSLGPLSKPHLGEATCNFSANL